MKPREQCSAATELPKGLIFVDGFVNAFPKKSGLGLAQQAVDTFRTKAEKLLQKSEAFQDEQRKEQYADLATKLGLAADQISNILKNLGSQLETPFEKQYNIGRHRRP